MKRILTVPFSGSIAWIAPLNNFWTIPTKTYQHIHIHTLSSN